MKSIALVGLMGAGKTRVGREVAKIFDIPFVDADREIEYSAGCSVQEIFELYGEKGFRDGERKVINRLLQGEAIVLATGGGAFINDETRQRIKKKAISVWLRADIELLLYRTSRTNHRPLLKNVDAKKVLSDLIEQRYHIYAEADIVVDCEDEISPRAMAYRIRDIVLEYIDVND